MIFAAVIVVFIAITIVWFLKLNKYYAVLSLCRRILTIDGSDVEKIAPLAKGRTIFGNTFDMIAMNAEELFYYSTNFANELKSSYVLYILGSPVYNVIDANDAELVLTDPLLITKAITYRFLQPFLKTGLLTSTDKKWHARRKLLTPAFHFNILTQFEEIFKQESLKFVNNLKNSDDRVVSLDDLIPRFTLNNICETALGVQLDECLEADEYRENITKVEESFVKRVMNPFLTSDWAFRVFGDGKKDVQYLEKLHAFSSGIIEKRRALFEAAQEKNVGGSLNRSQEDFNFMNKKQRYAMLDTLLCAEKDGLIDHAGICEEVDTFMFEGFDTTSMNLIFVLMNLSLYPDMQQRCLNEINTYVDDDLNKLDIAQLSNLKYLDCFIKETQRLYPSVPLVLRECVQDTALANNLLLPKGTQIAVHIFDIQRNPKYYDSPEEFRPDRFLPENTEGRHPFAFIPFSAGQRNCIGQKFAMLEIKTLLIYMLKNFKLLPRTDPKTFRFLAGILIRSRSNVFIELERRENL